MLYDLFINTLLLISFTFVGGHLLKELSDKTKSSLYGRTLVGIGGGLLGILMMIYTIEVTGTNTLLDLRALSLMMISTVGGLVSTIIAGTLIILYRIGKYGINISSMFALLHMFLYIILFHIININIKTEWKSWFLKLGVSIFILSTTFLYLLRNTENHYMVVMNYILVLIFTGSLEYYLIMYTKRSNELYKMYKKDSAKDFLTGLNNTRNFDKLMNECFENVLKNKENLSCMMIDIDHFKKVNDTYGHAIGDIVLSDLASILKKSCRSFDIIGRVGGEEFCILLLDCPLHRACEIGTIIRNSVKSHEFLIAENKFINITVSIGISTYPDTVDNLDELMEKADVALYKAKQTGRDRVKCNMECVIE